MVQSEKAHAHRGSQYQGNMMMLFSSCLQAKHYKLLFGAICIFLINGCSGTQLSHEGMAVREIDWKWFDKCQQLAVLSVTMGAFEATQQSRWNLHKNEAAKIGGNAIFHSLSQGSSMVFLCDFKVLEAPKTAEKPINIVPSGGLRYEAVDKAISAAPAINQQFITDHITSLRKQRLAYSLEVELALVLYLSSFPDRLSLISAPSHTETNPASFFKKPDYKLRMFTCNIQSVQDAVYICSFFYDYPTPFGFAFKDPKGKYSALIEYFHKANQPFIVYGVFSETVSVHTILGFNRDSIRIPMLTKIFIP